MKTLKCLYFLLLACLFVACQASTSKVIPFTETVQLPTKTELLQTPERIIQPTNTLVQNTIAPTPTDTLVQSTISPTPKDTLVHSTITPNIIATNIEFPQELHGRLFIGSSQLGEYFELNFEQKKILSYRLPNDCQLLMNGREAICDLDPYTDETVTYVYDVINSRKIFPFDTPGGRWRLTSSESLLEYVRVDQHQRIIEVYDLKSKETSLLGGFDHQEMRLLIPRLSNSGNALIGLDEQGVNWENDDQWYFIRTELFTYEPLLVPNYIAATDSFEWSSDDAKVALVGFYSDDEIGHAGTLQCGKEVLIYDPLTQVITNSIKIPDKKCITPMSLYPHHIWSPDNSKIVLILDMQDVCIIDLAGKDSMCSLITSNIGTNEHILSLSWSPDSKNIAYILTNGEIMVYTFGDGESKKITNLDELSLLFIGENLVWAQ